VDLSASIDIDRPVGVVYEFVAELSNDGRWRAGVLESGIEDDVPATPGVVGYSRIEGQGDPMLIHWRILEVAEPEHISWEMLDGPFTGKGGYRLEQIEAATRFTLLADIQPQGAYRLLGPLFGWMGRRRNRADVATLKRILEGQTSHTSTR
jgi:hypothetical protein